MHLIVAILLAAAPDWTSQGKSPRYPQDKFATAMCFGESLDAAKVAAAADVARSLTTRIESQMTDLFTAANGQEKQTITALSKASTDVRLSGLTYETFSEGGKFYALAVLDRAAASAEERRLRDAAVAEMKAAVASADAAKGREGEALKALLAARTAIVEALKHENLSRVIARTGDAQPPSDLAQAARGIEDRVAALLHKPQSTVREAVEALAFQLEQQGVARGAKIQLPPFTYRTTIYPSVFGRAVAQDLDRALGAAVPASTVEGDLVLKGTYAEEKDAIRLIVVARDVRSGRTVASAEATVPAKAVPADQPLQPPNMLQALRDQKILGVGEEVNGALKVELVTNKQDAVSGSQVFAAGEELKLFVKVNKPAYVRLVYALNNGAKVPLSQAWFIDEAKVNRLVEFTDAFEIAAPFGAEHLQAVAFTEKPQPLPTKKQVFEGVEYDVVAEGTEALVGHRGFVKKKQSETSEAVVSITTMPR